VDFHHLLLAGLPGAPTNWCAMSCSTMPRRSFR
jgi:hypothetical protein